VGQAAKSVRSSHEALVDFLESIGQFINRLDIYTRIPLTLAMVEMVIRIMTGILSTLALVTKELKQGRSSECIFAQVIPLLTVTQLNL
jgi:hypothetical protein